jgi:phage terminase large subunit GpA-like protein
MGFLASAEAVVFAAAAKVMSPPDPPDITAWCERNIVFDERSPMPGPFRIERFPFLREIHEVFSPEHPCREVTVRGSAQWGKTVSLLQPTIGAWHEYGPLDSLVVHPTQSAATEWVRNKWLPMRRQAPGLRAIFGDGSGANSDSLFNQETLDRNGSLKVASAGSPADLTGTTRRLVIGDDIAKWEMTDMGDPETLMVSRAAAFEDAKIGRISTAMFSGTCRITKAFLRSDQRFYHVPCPHCGNMAPLTWENFKASIDPANLHAAHFTCEACGCVIDHGHKVDMVSKGKWVPHNPRGDHPGFHLWRAYVPQRDWASIAVEYAQVMGWSRMTVSEATEAAIRKDVAAETEQTFFNDVLGLPYEIASKGPDWEALRDRVENAAPGTVLPRGIVPAKGVILTAGVDFQGDRIEVQIAAFGPNFQRWVIDYIVIPHFIGDDEGRAALNALLKSTWRTQLGRRIALDMMAADVGTFESDVWDWAKKHRWDRVILVKGATTSNGPIMVPMKFERRADGLALKQQKRAFMLNVSQLKGDFFGWLAKEDPLDRGYVTFAAGLGDEYYRQITSEVRVLTTSRSGVTTAAWKIVDSVRRNEGLDTMNYAEAAARRKGFANMTPDQWAVLEAERSTEPPEAERQPDLLDALVPIVPPVGTRPAATPKEMPQKGLDDWMGGRGKDWF